MPTYRAVASTETDPQAPITSALMKALVDNVLAALEGDSTASAAGVTVKDASLDTGAATTAGTTWVGLRVANMATGAVGTYAFLLFNTNTTASPGSTHAGSGLRYASASGTNYGAGGLSGTWRLMGQTTNTSGVNSTSLFLRIS